MHFAVRASGQAACTIASEITYPTADASRQLGGKREWTSWEVTADQLGTGVLREMRISITPVFLSLLSVLFDMYLHLI
jgi:hypothetical protein